MIIMTLCLCPEYTFPEYTKPDMSISQIQHSLIFTMDFTKSPRSEPWDTPFGSAGHVIPNVDFPNIVGIGVIQEINVREIDIDPLS